MKKRVIAIILLSLICIETVFAGEIVKPQSIYESVNFSKSVNKTIMALKERYPDTIKVFEIGKSVQGEAILAVEGYKGPSMISEPETKALVELCQERLFDGTVSYHSSDTKVSGKKIKTFQ
ncbi:MAG TPA: hypothetical protein GX707_13315 [Epulopiscium sp.]|nr:hypothetical protein [Candidatus Epulonipiscium sp.]